MMDKYVLVGIYPRYHQFPYIKHLFGTNLSRINRHNTLIVESCFHSIKTARL